MPEGRLSLPTCACRCEKYGKTKGTSFLVVCLYGSFGSMPTRSCQHTWSQPPCQPSHVLSFSSCEEPKGHLLVPSFHAIIVVFFGGVLRFFRPKSKDDAGQVLQESTANRATNCKSTAAPTIVAVPNPGKPASGTPAEMFKAGGQATVFRFRPQN